MNSFHKGEWGKEERKSNPLKKGEPFDIRIRAHDSKFQASRGGKTINKNRRLNNLGDYEWKGVEGI
jgi:hypothetical protein